MDETVSKLDMMKLEEKREFMKIIKKHKLFKTLVITIYAIMNRGYAHKNTVEETLEHVINSYHNDERHILSWLIPWKHSINREIEKTNGQLFIKRGYNQWNG